MKHSRPRLWSRILASASTKKILSNTGWLVGEKVIRLSVTLFVSAWLARYLGPSNFGMLSYAIAFTALFGSITTMGLDGIVVRDIVNTPENKHETLGTAFGLRLIGGLLSYLINLLIIARLHPDNPQTAIIIAIIAAGIVFQSFDCIDLWFQSQVQSKFSLYARVPAFLAGSIGKACLILAQAPLVAFAWATVAETVLAAIGLLVIYRLRAAKELKWRFSRRAAASLLKQSWPLILSGIAAAVYMKIDQIMLGQLSGQSELGIYSAAAKLSEVWYFLPLAIASSAFPSMVEAKKQGEAHYTRRMQQLFNVMFWASLIISIPIALSSQLIIGLLYGPDFARAAPMLAIHIWASLFIFMRAILSKWLIAEGLLVFSLVSHGMGAVSNVLLNWVLIPRYGGVGAAIATVVSYAAASYFFCILHPKTWVAGRMMTLALFSPVRFVLQSRPLGGARLIVK